MRGCRSCGSDRICSWDRYHASCEGRVAADGTWTPGGYTEISWDTCKQYAWGCLDCGEMVDITPQRNESQALAELVGLSEPTEEVERV